jgi:hypothetical protein
MLAEDVPSVAVRVNGKDVSGLKKVPARKAGPGIVLTPRNYAICLNFRRRLRFGEAFRIYGPSSRDRPSSRDVTWMNF